MSTFAWPAFAPPSDAGDADQLLESARSRAREEGYVQGQQQALAEQAEGKATLLAALQELTAARDGLATDYQAAITRLLFDGLAALLRVELVTNPDAVANLVAEALAVLNAKLEAVSVRANPLDLDWLPATGDIELIADDTVPVGGLAVSMPDLCVEFDLLGKLRGVADELQGVDVDESSADKP